MVVRHRFKITKGILVGAVLIVLVFGLIGVACSSGATPTPTGVAKEPAQKAPAPTAAAAPTKPADAVSPTPAAAAPAKPAASEPAKPAAAKPGAQGNRLVVAVPQWGTETPFGWKNTHAERTVWDHVYDPLLISDPKTFKEQPGLATEWSHSPDYKQWTFKLRQGVQFHENWGELTSEDVKFSIEQNLRADASSLQTGFFKVNLAGIDTPDKYTVVMNFKSPLWTVPAQMSSLSGLQTFTSKKYIQQVGEEKAAQHPIGTGPYRHVEGKQGDYHRFEAVPNHWRVTPGFKELVVRRVGDPGTRLAGVRSGEIDIALVEGDYVAQAKSASLRIVERPQVQQYWVVLPGQTAPDMPDYCPQCPWVGDPKDSKSLENARKVRLALNLAIDKKAIIDKLWMGYGTQTPFSYWFYPQHQGYNADWKIPAYDPQKAKQLLTEAGYPNGFEINVLAVAQVPDGPDVAEAVAQDWTKLGLNVKRAKEDVPSFFTKIRARKLGVQAWVYGFNAYSDPILNWEGAITTKGAVTLLADKSEHDDAVKAIVSELDDAKRLKLKVDLGQKLYDQYYGAQIGIKSITWAVSKKVADWPMWVPSIYVNNYEYITWSGQ